MKKTVRNKLYNQISSLTGEELKQGFRYLDNERTLFESILNVLQESILLINENGFIKFYNNAALNLLNIPKNISNCAPLWHWLPVLKPFFSEKTKDASPNILSKECELVYPEKKYVRLHMQLFDKPNKDIKQFIIILQDVTIERAISAKRSLDERFESIVQLSSELAHEIGNPLNSISIYLQLIKKDLMLLKKNDKLKNSVQICQDEVSRLNEIIKHFLKAIRKQPITLQKTNVVPILKDLLSILKPQLNNLNIDVELSIKAPLSMIFCDKIRLHQAFFNVIKNGIEAIGTNGKIVISCYQDDYYLIIAFADSGSGISDVCMATMTSKNNVTQKQNGNGIGMLIIQRVMQEHNGLIEIESKKNVGSILYLKFPLLEKSFYKLENFSKISNKTL